MPKEVIINAREKDFDDEKEARNYAGKYVFKRLTAGQMAVIIDESTMYGRRGQTRTQTGLKKIIELRESMAECPAKGDKTEFIKKMPDWLFNKLYVMGYGQTLRGITKEEEIFLERLLQTD